MIQKVKDINGNKFWEVDRRTYIVAYCVVFGILFLLGGYFLHLCSVGLWMRNLKTSLEEEVAEMEASNETLKKITQKSNSTGHQIIYAKISNGNNTKNLNDVNLGDANKIIIEKHGQAAEMESKILMPGYFMISTGNFIDTARKITQKSDSLLFFIEANFSNSIDSNSKNIEDTLWTRGKITNSEPDRILASNNDYGIVHVILVDKFESKSQAQIELLLLDSKGIKNAEITHIPSNSYYSITVGKFDDYVHANIFQKRLEELGIFTQVRIMQLK